MRSLPAISSGQACACIGDGAVKVRVASSISLLKPGHPPPPFVTPSFPSLKSRFTPAETSSTPLEISSTPLELRPPLLRRLQARSRHHQPRSSSRQRLLRPQQPLSRLHPPLLRPLQPRSRHHQGLSSSRQCLLRAQQPLSNTCRLLEREQLCLTTRDVSRIARVRPHNYSFRSKGRDSAASGDDGSSISTPFSFFWSAT